MTKGRGHFLPRRDSQKWKAHTHTHTHTTWLFCKQISSRAAEGIFYLPTYLVAIPTNDYSPYLPPPFYPNQRLYSPLFHTQQAAYPPCKLTPSPPLSLRLGGPEQVLWGGAMRMVCRQWFNLYEKGVMCVWGRGDDGFRILLLVSVVVI